MNENKAVVRKQFVFILNYAVDLTKKQEILGDDLILFSNEIRKFNTWLQSQNIEPEIKDRLSMVQFHYSSTRNDISDSFYLLFRNFLVDWFQQRNRRSLLDDFLNKYDRYLKLFD